MSLVRDGGLRFPFSTDPSRQRPTQAFTLIEILLAVSILGIGIVGVLGAFVGSMRAATSIDHRMDALAIAEKQLALGVTLPADKLNEQDGTSGRFEWKLIYVPKAGGLMMASVTVQWKSRNEPQIFTLSQIFSPRDRER